MTSNYLYLYMQIKICKRLLLLNAPPSSNIVAEAGEMRRQIP